MKYNLPGVLQTSTEFQYNEFPNTYDETPCFRPIEPVSPPRVSTSKLDKSAPEIDEFPEAHLDTAHHQGQPKDDNFLSMFREEDLGLRDRAIG